MDHRIQEDGVNLDGFNRSAAAATAMLGTWLVVEFNKPYTDVYHPDEISSRTLSAPGTVSKLLDNAYRRSLVELYEELEDEASINSQGLRAGPP